MNELLTLSKFNDTELIFLVYLSFINIVAFITIAIDKRKAKKKNYRISENTLIIISIVGGSIGTLLGMTIFRHKTKKKKFCIGVPIIYLINQFMILMVFNYIK